MKKIYLPLLGVFCFLFSHSSSAQEMLLKADGLTQGLGVIKDYQDYVVISGVQFTVDAESSFTDGTLPSTGQADFKEITITKNTDVFTANLLNSITKGRVIDKLEILITKKPDASKPMVVVQKIELNNVVVTDMSLVAVSGCTGNCGFAESIKLIYKQVQVTVYELNKNNVPVNANVFSFDVTKKTETFNP